MGIHPKGGKDIKTVGKPILKKYRETFSNSLNHTMTSTGSDLVPVTRHCCRVPQVPGACVTHTGVTGWTRGGSGGVFVLF